MLCEIEDGAYVREKRAAAAACDSAWMARRDHVVEGLTLARLANTAYLHLKVQLVSLKRGNGDKFALKEMDRKEVEKTDFMGQVLAERDIMVRLCADLERVACGVQGTP